MIICIRRTALLKDSVLHVSTEVMVHALERNFNGVSKDKFSNICAAFIDRFTRDKSSTKKVLRDNCRHPIKILQDSLSEVQARNSSRFILPRYKMIIDQTNDDSIMRLLCLSGILNSSHSFYKLSGLEEGAEFEQLNLVSRVKYAAQQGKKTVVLSQVEAVSECFYDLFNQHFKEFRKEGKVSYFANIAMGGISRPCSISPSFQCIVHVQSSKLDETPAPYLNRFEKFNLTIDDILSWQISRLPLGVGVMLSNALCESEEFLLKLGNASIWTTSSDDSLKSIFISMVPQDVDAHQISNLNEQVHCNNLISSFVLSFVKQWFVMDVDGDDIQQAISIAVEEFSGTDAVELKKVLEDDSFIQGEANKTLKELASGSRDSPVLRSLEAIVHLVLRRYATMKLLQVAMPEAIYLQR